MEALLDEIKAVDQVNSYKESCKYLCEFSAYICYNVNY